MSNSIQEKPRGILNAKAGAQKFELARYEPSDLLAPFVEHFWIVKWDLRGLTPYRTETLPHPSIHIAIEPCAAHIVGIVTRKFSRILRDEDWVFGIKFKPGGFYPFIQRPIVDFTDKCVGLADAFGAAGIELESALRAAKTDPQKVAIAEDFLRQLAPAHDDNLALISQIVEAISTERTITKVDHLVERFKRNKRTLQRLFHHYVGASPKWTIQRYRLHEALEQVAAGETIEWSKLALELGYFDQAHFINDFKAMVGMTPAEYAKKTEG